MIIAKAKILKNRNDIAAVDYLICNFWIKITQINWYDDVTHTLNVFWKRFKTFDCNS